MADARADVSDGRAGGARRDEGALITGNTFVAGRRGAQPERTDVTVSDGGAGGARRDEGALITGNTFVAGRRGAQPERTIEDAAAVIAVIAALAARGTGSGSGVTPPPPRSVWKAVPPRAAPAPGPHAWWASGLIP